MTIDRDSNLENLFDVARQDLSGEVFTDRVMSQIDMQRRSAVFGWASIGVVLAICAWLLAEPILDVVTLTTQVLPQSLIELDDGWQAQLLSPVNSIASVVAFGFLGLRMAYRKIFS
jgi:hypothetical protein